MAFRFKKLLGIGVQSMLLVLVLVGLTVWLLPRMMEPKARYVVWEHELLDLGEETRERGWAVLDQITSLQGDVALLARSLEDGKKGDDELARMKKQYLRIWEWRTQLDKKDAGLDDGASLPQDLGGTADPDWSNDSLKKFRDQLLRTGVSGVDLSSIYRSTFKLKDPEATKENLGQSEVHYVIWAAREIPAPKKRAGDPRRILIIAMSLDDLFRQLVGSARHLGIVFQREDPEPLLKPLGSLTKQDDRAEYEEATIKLFKDELFDERQQIREDVFQVRETWRLTTGKTFPNVPTLSDSGVKFYFCESKHIAAELADAKRRIAADALDRLNARWVGEDWTKRDPCLRRVWGFDESRQRIRLLVSDRRQLPAIQEEALKELRRVLPDESDLFSKVRWETEVPGQTCDVNFVRVTLRPGDKSPFLILGRAQFEEELAADLAWELAPVHHRAWIWGGIAALIALVFSVVITRPLKRMTHAALAVAQIGAKSSSDDWEDIVAKVNEKLPTWRWDEIGVLAHAFRRMLLEVRDSHLKLLDLNRELEVRVQGRTRELKDANEKLRETNLQLTEAHQAQKQLVFSISHDLKTPLTTVKGYCELLMQSPLTDEQREDLTTVYLARERLQRLIEDIIDSQKIDLRELDLDWREFDVAELFREVGREMIPSARKNGNTLQVECQSGLPPMCSDPDKVSRVLSNLLSNACKFTKQGTITVSAASETSQGRDWLVVSVADTGRGIDPSLKDKIFRPFPKILKKEDNPEGTGLGLSNCKGYCEAMGGTIGFQSEPGRGTTFTARLPLRPAPNGPASVRAKEQHAGHLDSTRSQAAVSPRSNCVLVVDDNDEVRNLLKRFLEKLGFAVETAASGDEAIARVEKLRPVLITLDAMMPGRDGWTVLKDLKADPKTCEIPVIMVSVLDDKSRGFALGASDYITKPIDWERLTRTINSFRSGAAGTILVVDDDPEIRTLASRQLGAHGWAVVEAENGRAALDRLREACPSIILLDLLMPEMDGFEFLQRLRGNPQWTGIPVLVVTAKDLTAAEREQINGRVVQIIQKGALHWDELELEISRLVSQYVAKEVAAVKETR
jgi:signal transduction histidine kinase/CheY-like chemotaxis protein